MVDPGDGRATTHRLRRARRQWMYTRTVPRARELRPRHSVQNQWDLLGAIDGWTAEAPIPRGTASDAGRSARRSTHRRPAAAAAPTPADELIVLHAQRQQPVPSWPEPAFAELAAALAAASPARRIASARARRIATAADRIAATAREQLPAQPGRG